MDGNHQTSTRDISKRWWKNTTSNYRDQFFCEKTQHTYAIRNFGNFSALIGDGGTGYPKPNLQCKRQFSPKNLILALGNKIWRFWQICTFRALEKLYCRTIFDEFREVIYVFAPRKVLKIDKNRILGCFGKNRGFWGFLGLSRRPFSGFWILPNMIYVFFHFLK